MQNVFRFTGSVIPSRNASLVRSGVLVLGESSVWDWHIWKYSYSACVAILSSLSASALCVGAGFSSAASHRTDIREKLTTFLLMTLHRMKVKRSEMKNLFTGKMKWYEAPLILSLATEPPNSHSPPFPSHTDKTRIQCLIQHNKTALCE